MGSGTLAPEHLAAMGQLLLYWVLILSTIPCLISSPQFGSNSPCSPSPCGPGALCENKGLGQVLCSCPPGQTGDPLAEGCSPDTRRRPLDGAGGRGGGGGFSFGSRGQSSSGFGGSVSNSGFGGSSNFGGTSSSFGGESCNRLSDCQFDRSSILDNTPKSLSAQSVWDTYIKCAMKILE